MIEIRGEEKVGFGERGLWSTMRVSDNFVCIYYVRKNVVLTGVGVADI